MNRREFLEKNLKYGLAIGAAGTIASSKDGITSVPEEWAWRDPQ